MCSAKFSRAWAHDFMNIIIGGGIFHTSKYMQLISCRNYQHGTNKNKQPPVQPYPRGYIDWSKSLPCLKSYTKLLSLYVFTIIYVCKYIVQYSTTLLLYFVNISNLFKYQTFFNKNVLPFYKKVLLFLLVSSKKHLDSWNSIVYWATWVLAVLFLNKYKKTYFVT